MRIDLLYHYFAGQVMSKTFELIGLNTTDNAIVSGVVMVGKECIDKSFDVLDIAFGVLGWLTML
jgi:hypothetical protein